jgi:hypothetical protein
MIVFICDCDSQGAKESTAHNCLSRCHCLFLLHTKAANFTLKWVYVQDTNNNNCSYGCITYWISDTANMIVTICDFDAQ